MQQLNEAMQQMTPEQRQMMEQFGLGGMMQQAPAANLATQSADATSATSAMPSSEELYSDDLTQMVQNHLDALGYDTGNTSGEMSLETTIAISQFQAEKGLDVTGEVSPQLAGMLSAEVDRQRGN
jgi:peptidoglycan hydrolase-like protein with peptidoglycan-binding domain